MRDSGARVNLEESCGPVKWTRTWGLDAKWRRGGEEAAEAEWDGASLGRVRSVQHPGLGSGDARISHPWECREWRGSKAGSEPVLETRQSCPDSAPSSPHAVFPAPCGVQMRRRQAQSHAAWW